MGWRPFPRRIFVWPRRSAAQIRHDVEAELEHHLDLVAEELESRGRSPEQARREARERFGNLGDARREMIRDDRRFERRLRLRSTLRSVREDIGYALRQFRARPGHTAVTLATLAIGITTATIFFGAVDGILLQPVALDEPEQVMHVWGTEASSGAEREGLAPATVRDLDERSRSFAAVAAGQPHSFDVEGPAGPISVNAWIVSPRWFDVLRARPAAGRLLGPADFDAGAEPTVVITHAFWLSQFGGDPDAIGGTLALDGVPHVVLGVVPADFPEKSRDLFVPRTAGSELWQSRDATFFTGYGRLRAGVSPEAASAELDELAGVLARDFPEANEGLGFEMTSLRSSLVEDVRDGLWLLFAAAVLILVIAGVNAAGLLLAEAATRTRELAVRSAVGAGRGRLVRQLVTETALLAVLAAGIALPLAGAGLGVFRRASPPGMPRIEELGMSAGTVVFATAAAFFVALLVGLVPAFRVARPDLYEALKPGGRSGTLTPGSARLRSVLVGFEVAIAVVLLVGGGLLLRSWVLVLDTEQGYVADGVAAVETHYWHLHDSDAGRVEFARRVVERLGAAPGVEAAGVTTSLPLAEQIGNEDGEILPEGASTARAVRWTVIDPGLLETLEISIVEGRSFTDGDALGAELVALVNREAVRRFWPDGSPIGRVVEIGGGGPRAPHRIVGVVEDVHFGGLEAAVAPAVYVPHAQATDGSVYFTVRTSDDSGLRTLRRVLAELQPSLVVAGEVVLADEVSAAGQPRRFSLMLLTAFGLTALLLTGVGLFGHLSHSILTRQHELGVRLALGAWPARLVRAVTGQGVVLVVAGAATGLVLAFTVSRFMAALLYEVAPADPFTFAAAAAVVLAVGAAASYVPARRVARVDPAAALRIE